ncbi:hypothetical protein [Oceanobacillus rekensis]|uniref:hypothetical protein n=1 Tax=Oceanobacillus rekensis TaxID=937927 RepID=UPI000B438AB7|nr:hypothetical protein [Oceanobacillus rekensis]
MKKLKIYKGNNEFVIERINEFDHSFKSQYITENGLLEAVEAYRPIIYEYELIVEPGINIFPKVCHVLFA